MLSLLKWKGTSFAGHCNYPNWKREQVARRFKGGLCLSAHGSLAGFHTVYHSELLLWHRLACPVLTHKTTHDLQTHQNLFLQFLSTNSLHQGLYIGKTYNQQLLKMY